MGDIARLLGLLVKDAMDWIHCISDTHRDYPKMLLTKIKPNIEKLWGNNISFSFFIVHHEIAK